jgi:hypothetical protein
VSKRRERKERTERGTESRKQNIQIKSFSSLSNLFSPELVLIPEEGEEAAECSDGAGFPPKLCL